MGVIYVRTNRFNGKQYVGQVITKRFKQRQNSWKNLKQPYAGVAINRAREKYGLDAFDFEILKECEDEKLNYWEMYYIKELNTKTPYGYNMTDGGDTIIGYSHTEKWKKQHSEKMKGNQFRLGIKHTEETLLNFSIKRKGHPVSDETKKKMRQSHINGKNSKTILQIDKNTNEVIAEFPSTMEVQRQFGYEHAAINRCCYNKQKTSYGFIWKYKEDAA